MKYIIKIFLLVCTAAGVKAYETEKAVVIYYSAEQSQQAQKLRASIVEVSSVPGEFIQLCSTEYDCYQLKNDQRLRSRAEAIVELCLDQESTGSEFNLLKFNKKKWIKKFRVFHTVQREGDQLTEEKSTEEKLIEGQQL